MMNPPRGIGGASKEIIGSRRHSSTVPRACEFAKIRNGPIPTTDDGTNDHGRQPDAAVSGCRGRVQESPGPRGSPRLPEEDVDPAAEAQGEREAAGRAEEE